MALRTYAGGCPYRIGSYLYTDDKNFNPNTTYSGTTWKQIKDKFLLACGDTYESGTTGGEVSHTLSTSEMPVHSHYTEGVNDGTTVQGQMGSYPTRIYQDKKPNWKVSYIGNAGGGQAHNNMPPYLAVYIWVRTK